jgi:hypothetical protein
MSPAVANSASTATIETGRVFGSAGIDGLILWALVLMGLAGVVVAIIAIIFGYRAIARKDEACSEDRRAFTDASNTASVAMRELATSIATKNSNDIAAYSTVAAHQAQLTGVLARVEEALNSRDHDRRFHGS